MQRPISRNPEIPQAQNAQSQTQRFKFYSGSHESAILSHAAGYPTQQAQGQAGASSTSRRPGRWPAVVADRTTKQTERDTGKKHIYIVGTKDSVVLFLEVWYLLDWVVVTRCHSHCLGCCHFCLRSLRNYCCCQRGYYLYHGYIAFGFRIRTVVCVYSRTVFARSSTCRIDDGLVEGSDDWYSSRS